MSSCPTGSSYEPIGAVEAFHGIPHTDIDLQDTPSDFDPSNTDYWEAIIIWACVPILVCLCILILMSIYFICICCCCCCGGTREWSKKPKIACGIFNIILIVILIVILAVGLWSEVELDNEVNRLLDMGRDTQDFFDQYGPESPLYTEARQNASLENLQMALDQQEDPNATIAEEAVDNMIIGNVRLGKQFSEINDKVGSINLDDIIDEADEFELIRHWVVIAYVIVVIIILMVAMLAILCGICISSPAFLIIMIVVLAVVTLTMWVAAGGSLAFLVVSADICDDPDRLIRNLTEDQSIPVDKDVLDYYLICNETCYQNPFSQAISESIIAFEEIARQEAVVQSYINSSSNASVLQPLQDEVVSGFSGSMTAVDDISTCTRINDIYLDSLQTVCEDAYTFVVVQFGLLCGVCVGLMALILTTTCQAGLFCNNRKEYDEEALAYEFPNESSPSAWQSYGTQQHYNSAYTQYREQTFNLTGTSEPPKYNELHPVSNGERPPSEGYDRTFDS